MLEDLKACFTFKIICIFYEHKVINTQQKVSKFLFCHQNSGTKKMNNVSNKAIQDQGQVYYQELLTSSPLLSLPTNISFLL